MLIWSSSGGVRAVRRIRRMVQSEMVARTLKNLLRHLLRERHRAQGAHPSRFGALEAVVGFLNHVTGATAGGDFWASQVREWGERGRDEWVDGWSD